MNIKDDEIMVPDIDAVPEVIIPEHKPFTNLFNKLYCSDCNTHLNGSTICSNCGKDQTE